MSRLTIVFALALVSMTARAESPTVARIDHAFPPARDLRRPDGSFGGVDGPVLAYTPDGRAVITAAGDTAKMWSARTGEDLTGALMRTFAGQKGHIVALGWRGEAELVSLSDRRTVQSWDLATGEARRATTLKPALRNAVFRPGKEPLLAGLVAGQLGLWNYETGEAGKVLEPKDPAVRALAFSVDGKWLAAGDDKGTVRVWDADSGALSRSFEAKTAIRSVAVSASNVAAGLADGVVKLWSLEASAPSPAMTGHKGAVGGLAFSGKGDLLASIAGDRVMRVWDVGTGQLLCEDEAQAAVLAFAFNPNGQKLASAGADHTLRIWTIPLTPIAPEDLKKIEAALPQKATVAPKKPRKLLVFWRADAILHKGGTVAANHALQLMGQRTGAFEAHFTRDFEALDPKVLAGYDALVLNNTAHLAIPERAKKALLDYANGGGGIVGIHSAIDTFKGWPEGAKIVGATFAGHPWHPSGTWSVSLEEPAHPLLRAWGGKDFKMHDEFYELGAPYDRADRRVLMHLDLRDPVTANVTPLHRADKDFAVSWVKRQGRGRVFYCMFGHLGDPFQDPRVLQYDLDGIQYALGDLDVDASPRPPKTAAK